jgi:hypothetical protein
MQAQSVLRVNFMPLHLFLPDWTFRAIIHWNFCPCLNRISVLYVSNEEHLALECRGVRTLDYQSDLS